ncbi:MAG: TonB-dependent receptor [Bacteroidetes bacterium]|nr:TonB-dependent receptor [Bacteroidota bacterium]
MKTILYIAHLLLFAFFVGQAKAENTQTIKGQVLDKQSQSPVIGATIIILASNPLQGATTDVNGQFTILQVKPGRYELKVSYSGYKELVIPGIVVTSGKEVILDISIEETVKHLKSATVKGTSKNRVLNEMSTVSARTFSMEEVNRYAGGRSDPARLAANFAGVSSPDDSRNDIVIRGNSPAGVLWRIEGMNIQNPNHFATIGTTGGPVSALNTNMLKNSDFFTSAFPSEYGNANAGVFDLGFRKGNSDKREHTLQFGMLTGLEAMTEGPIKKGNGSSYLLAYRYSFTGIAQALGIPIGTTATPFYQDLSFKVVSGNSKLGRFTLFGLGGKSNIKFMHDEIDTSDLFADPTMDSYFRSDIAVVGVKHYIKTSEKSFLNTMVGASYAASKYDQDSIAINEGPSARIIENSTQRLHYNIASTFNMKVNSAWSIKAGVQAEIMQLDLFYRTRSFSTVDWKQLWDFDDATTLVQAFAQTKYNLSNKLTMNAGMHAQYLTLNGSYSIEPRAGLRYALTDKSTLSAGYGLHSQMQPTDVYFFKTMQLDGTYNESNKDLGFTRSHQAVIGYEILPIKDWRIKTELYYQVLRNVPVTMLPGSYSMLNTGSSFYPNQESYLENTGKGRNYGAEITVEKFFSRGYYGLLTGTIYESKYTGSDKVERNTAFNGKYVYNLLAGKEFKFGKAKRNAFTIDCKLTQAGGRYYTPVDLEASKASNEQVLMGDEYAFSKRNPDFFRMDLKAGMTVNSKKRKLSHSFYFDVQNITNHKNVFAERYNPVTETVNTAYQIGVFPNFIYKVQF